jgi:hypothetical protein
VRRLGTRVGLRLVQAFDRLRLALRAARQPGLRIDPSASSNLACARFRLGSGAQLRIGPRVVTERRPGLHFLLEPGARVDVGEDTWLRTEVGPVHVVAFAGARIEIGPEGLLNGCHLSAKRALRIGRRVWIGPGTRIFDADQHDRDAGRPERVDPVEIGDCAWIASDVTVLRGVRIGEHSIVGTRSLVTRDVPPHALAFGQPAVPRGPVGDRSNAR